MELFTDLAFIWAGIIAFSVLAYVVLDGFDLGIGILFPFIRSRDHRDVMVNSVAPVWDGNETWLIMGGGGLYAAFPVAYAILMPALYAPLIAMLLGLVFRGVAFEFRFRATRNKILWDIAFSAGSYVAAFCQGIALGTVIQGIAVEGRAYAGGWFDWLTPFSLFTGLALVLGYALLGASWLVMKCEGELRIILFDKLLPIGVLVLVVMGGVSLWTPFLDAGIAERWFSLPNFFFLSPVPLLVLAITVLFYRAVQRMDDVQPFFLAEALFVVSFIGLGVSLFPYIVPRSFTIWQAAAPDNSLSFLLVGASVLIPIILIYTAYAYWVFRGKVDTEASYH